ncbi:MAG: NADH-quinone oxidoreductase subunit D [Calditrichaeota bacterium]|nr:MAG: NADH-quinone oxidoreductase subunit D [Calditrichota bacterium]
MSKNIFQALRKRFPDQIYDAYTYRGDAIVVIDRRALVEICRFLRDDPTWQFRMLVDLAGVDYLGREPRFEVVYLLHSFKDNARLRLKVPVDERDPQVPTVSHLWHIANWYEREVWDMFGIRFKGHPDLRRLLMYDEFKGHPLRKDYPLCKRQPLVTAEKSHPGTTLPTVELTHKAMDEYVSEENGIKVKHMFLNMGPSHPAMHGVIKIILQLDGERVVDSDLGIGYLHRSFEKHAENIYYNGVFPYTDRLNYVSPLINNVGYALTVEKLLGIEVTERCKYIRMIMSEISRIADHLTCIGAMAMELGAMTAFLYFMKAREAMYELIEEVTGARITISYVRVGGVKGDLPPGFETRVRAKMKEVRKELKEVHKLLTRNRIFVDRVQHVGAISKEDAISYSFTGPMLRACGIEYDIRKVFPYCSYDQVEFDIPVGENGDIYDRYLVRMEEMEQSIRIVEQALAKMPRGNLMVDFEGKEIPAEKMADLGKFGQTQDLLHQVAVTDPTLLGSNEPYHEQVYVADKRVTLPAKEKTYGSIEGLMNHFMLIMEGYGIRPPRGEAYHPVEGANGELGFYIVSDGSDRAHRVRCRPPCFAYVAGFSKMIEGAQVADIIPTFGSINMIAGELDR